MRNLLVVDIQPAYDKHCHRVTKNVIRELTKAKNPVAMWVGHGLTYDTLSDVQGYFLDYGFPEDRLWEVEFIEKDYAFFRGWMDNDVEHGDIVKTVKRMYRAGVNDSREVKLPNHLSELCDCINIPDIDLDIFTGHHWNMCGGGRNECLKEIELWLRAIRVSYRLLNDMIYG
jgi:hypothetical protein